MEFSIEPPHAEGSSWIAAVMLFGTALTQLVALIRARSLHRRDRLTAAINADDSANERLFRIMNERLTAAESRAAALDDRLHEAERRIEQAHAAHEECERRIATLTAALQQRSRPGAEP